jgi:hypothetical protein
VKKRKTISLPIPAALLVLSLAIRPAAQGDDNFKWQDAAKELDTLPFSQAFVDSVKKLHTGGNTPGGLRQVNAGAFLNGETLVYEVGWEAFKAGYMILSATHFRGRGQIRLGGKAMTSDFVSTFYKMRDYVVSWVDADGMYPHFFEQHTRENNKYKMDSYIIYDNKKSKLFLGKGSSLKEYDSPPFTHDFLSVLYYARSMPLNPGDTFSADLFTAPKTDAITFKVHNKRESVKVGAGTFNCVLVEPKLAGEGKAFNKKSKIEVWVSDDEHKYPVMVKSKAKIGSLNAKLIQISQ